MPIPYNDETKAEIIRLYTSGISATDIGDLLNRDRNTIAHLLKNEGYELRRGAKPRRFTAEQEIDLAKRYEAGASAFDLAHQEGCGPTVVYSALKRQGVAIRTDNKGSRNGAWRGGRVKGPEGYMYIYIADDDSLISMRSMNRYAREHRIVMARALGRPLRSNEQVHHVNGVRSDNRLENLQLRSLAHGSGVCLTCGDCGSTNVMAKPLA